MTGTRLRPALSFVIIILIALVGLAQQQSGKLGTGSSPAQESPTVDVKSASSTPSVSPASSAKEQEESAVLAKLAPVLVEVKP
ncbi:MAG: hypothetical protein ABSG32_17295 [Terriglobia bacterium]|jgi:hypothetical protein